MGWHFDGQKMLSRKSEASLLTLLIIPDKTDLSKSGLEFIKAREKVADFDLAGLVHDKGFQRNS